MRTLFHLAISHVFPHWTNRWEAISWQPRRGPRKRGYFSYQPWENRGCCFWFSTRRISERVWALDSTTVWPHFIGDKNVTILPLVDLKCAVCFAAEFISKGWLKSCLIINVANLKRVFSIFPDTLKDSCTEARGQH